MPYRPRWLPATAVLLGLAQLAAAPPAARAAVPLDPFNGAASQFEEPSPEGRDYNLGDWGVAERRGVATYTFPLTVPAGRHAMTPDLALRYSSGSGLRGGLAVGWRLDLPAITRDRSLGRESKPVFQASLRDASGRLVQVPDLAPSDTTAYRLEFDTSMTRFVHRVAGFDDYWIAATSDGIRHYFGDALAAGDHVNRWLLSRQLDPFGNMVRYFWSRVASGPYVDYLIDRIEYSSNVRAGLAAHAKVDFTYAPFDLCPGSNIPIGAAPVQADPFQIEGSNKLIAVATSVRDTPDSDWRLARKTTLEYVLNSSELHEPLTDLTAYPAGTCPQVNLRYLTKIGVEAYDRNNRTSVSPDITFSYNHRERLLSTPSELDLGSQAPVQVPGFGEYGSTRGTVGRLIDLDSDGLRDWVSVVEKDGACTLTWQSGVRGGGFSPDVRESQLPTAAWHRPRMMGVEGCSLNGQVAYRDRPIVGGTTATRGVVSFHFLDYTGDGRVDLLTNVWAEGNHSSYEPVAGDELVPAVGTTGGVPPPVLPDPLTPETQGANSFVWRVYRNSGDPRAFPTPGDPDATFSSVAMTVTAPWHQSTDCSARPLPPSANDNVIDEATLPSLSIPSLVDLDGDGFLDLIDPGKGTKALRFGDDWCVFFGDGGPTFQEEPYRWPVPTVSVLHDAAGYDETITDASGQRHVLRTTGAALIDMNGDGRADLTVQAADGKLKAYLNEGNGFAIEPVDFGVTSPVEITQTDYAYEVDAVTNGARGYRLRLLDLDGDGLPDMLRLPGDLEDVTQVGQPMARFNAGDRFLPEVPLPQGWANAQRLTTFAAGSWHVLNDFFDADGDGLDDLATWSPDGSELTIVSSPGLPAASDLLRTVANGRGGTYRFSYGVSTDDALMVEPADRGARYNLPRPMPLTARVTVRPGFGAPEMATGYTYGSPAFLSASASPLVAEHARFLGYGRVRVDTLRDAVADSRREERDYAYVPLPAPLGTGAPDGLLVGERMYEYVDGAWRLHSHTRNSWQSLPTFDGQSLVIQQTSALTGLCDPDATEADCIAEPLSIRRTSETWEPYAPPDTKYVALYLRTAIQDGVGVLPGDLDKRSDYQYVVRYDSDPFDRYGYRILDSDTVESVAIAGTSGSQFSTVGLTHTVYDAVGSPVETSQWSDQATVATTVREYDPATGNLVKVVKPVQGAPGGSGLGSTFAYDPAEVYVAVTDNELGHRVMTTTDLATGTVIERRGPNSVVLTSGVREWDRDVWEIDGFGRTISHATAYDLGSAGYQMRTTRRTTYFDHELPNRVREEQLRDLGGSVWLTSGATFDGLGRRVSAAQVIDGPDPTTTFEYDFQGNVSAVWSPDPRSDDGTQVGRLYGRDGLGRIVQLTKPDESITRVRYSGLQKTIQEIAPDDTGSTTTFEYDDFGRLRAVRQRLSASEDALTTYGYDGSDNLASITDADGNATTLTYDWMGRRTSVTRSPRTWAVEYDLNGNVSALTSPHSSGDATVGVVRYRYDDLDRIILHEYRDVPDDLPTAPTNAVRLDQTRRVHYTYDENRNGVGRLTRVDLDNASVSFAYDAQGLPAEERRSFLIGQSPTGAITESVERTYNAAGALETSTWDDGQRWRLRYDQRGLVQSVDWWDLTSGDWQAVAAYERALFGPPRARTTAYGQTRRYTYDAMGRVISDNVAVGDGGMSVLERTYVFTDSGDLSSIDGTTDGASSTASYDYDALHRLIAADGPNGYTGRFSYTHAGNVATADVAWTDSPETRSVRYEYGSQDAQAVDRLIETDGGSEYASFEYDGAGNMIQQAVRGETTTLRWDALGRLRHAQTADAGEVYFYDHAGARMLAIGADNRMRSWFAERETHYDALGAVERRLLHLSDGASAIARVTDGTELELQYADALQNLQLALNRDGTVVASFLYGAFGEVVTSSGAEDHRRQFNGKEKDAVSSLSYYGARYYDSRSLRWVSADPLYRLVPENGLDQPQRLNLYSFSLNNPVRFYDPDGRDAGDTEGEDPDEYPICDVAVEADECTADPAEETSDPDAAAASTDADSARSAGEADAAPGRPAEGDIGYGVSAEQGKGSREIEAGIGWGSDDKGKGKKTKSVGVGGKVTAVEVGKEFGSDAAHAEATLTVGEASLGVSCEADGCKGQAGATLAEVEVCAGTCQDIGGGWSTCVEVCGAVGVFAEVEGKFGKTGIDTKAALGVVKASVKVEVRPPVELFENLR